MPPLLSLTEADRYARQLALPGVGVEGQRRLKEARVLIAGAGGLGSPAALYLAAAGVGHLGLADDDVVTTSNLQRQILYDTHDLGCSKLEAARRRLQALNPHVSVALHTQRVDASGAEALVAGYDVVIDGTDTLATRYALSGACVRLQRPYVYGSVYQHEGQASVFALPGAPCYRCLFPIPPPGELAPSCEAGGVLGVVSGLVGTIQATEALKLLLGLGSSLAGRLLLVDARTMAFDEIRLTRRPGCPACGHAVLDAEVTPPVAEPLPSITADALGRLQQQGEPLLLLDVRASHEPDGPLAPSLHIPLSELPSRLGELAPASAECLVVICQRGLRSAEAVRLLRAAGFPHAVSLEGGLDAYGRYFHPETP